MQCHRATPPSAQLRTKHGVPHVFLTWLLPWHRTLQFSKGALSTPSTQAQHVIRCAHLTDTLAGVQQVGDAVALGDPADGCSIVHPPCSQGNKCYSRNSFDRLRSCTLSGNIMRTKMLQIPCRKQSPRASAGCHLGF